MDFLGSPLWSGIGVLVAIILGIIAFVQGNKARNRKILAYDIVSDASVVNVNTEVKDRVKVLFDNNPIEDARLVVIAVLNGGDVPIQTADYENNAGITFDFGVGVEVLNIDLLETKPKGLKPSLSFKSENVFLEPLLLNSQDSFQFKVLVTGFKGKVEAKGRISDIKEIMIFDDLPRNTRKRILWYLATIVSIVSVVAFCLISVFAPKHPPSTLFEYILLYIYILSIIINITILPAALSLVKWPARKVKKP